MDAVKVVGISRGRWWVEDLLDRVDGSLVASMVSNVPTRVYPVVIIGKAFGVNNLVWASYFREVWKGLGSVGN